MLNTSQSFKHRNYSEETDKILLFVNLSNWPIQQMQFCVKIQFKNSCIALKFNLSYVKRNCFGADNHDVLLYLSGCHFVVSFRPRAGQSVLWNG